MGRQQENRETNIIWIVREKWLDWQMNEGEIAIRFIDVLGKKNLELIVFQTKMPFRSASEDRRTLFCKGLPPNVDQRDLEDLECFR